MNAEREEEILILLALLQLPYIRQACGYPAAGPLTQQQIAEFIGVDASTICKWEQQALARMEGALRRSGLLDELLENDHGN